MNRKQRRALARAAPAPERKRVARELKRRDEEKWSPECMLEQHKKCVTTGCGCPHHTAKVVDEKGRIVENVEVRDSGLYVARTALQVPPARR